MRAIRILEKFATHVLLVISFWVSPSYGSDSLRIGLAVQLSDRIDMTKIRSRLAEAIVQHSTLKIVHLDSLDADLFRSARISDPVRNRLRDQQLAAISLCTIQGDSSVSIELACADSFHVVRLAMVPLNAWDQADFAENIGQLIEKMLAIEKLFPKKFRIVVTRSEELARHSPLDSLEHKLIDSLKAIAANPLFAKVEVVFNSSDEQFSHQDRQGKMAEKYAEDLVLSWRVETATSSQSCFRPYLLVARRQTNAQLRSDAQPILSGKTCRLYQFQLPAIEPNNISVIVDFIRGYFLLAAKQYAEAADYFRHVQHFSGYFHLAECYWNQGLLFERDPSLAQADRHHAIQFWQRALSLAEDQHESAPVQNNIGAVFQFNRQQDSAMVYYQRAYSSLSNASDHESYIHIAQNLGNGYLMAGQWKQALDIFQSSIQAMEQAKDSMHLATTYENLGQIYQLLYQRNKAIVYYQKALELHEKMLDEPAMVNALILLGNAHQENKDFSLAISHFRQSLNLSLKNHHEPKIADSYDHLGLAFQQAGNLDSAIYYFEKSHEQYRILDNKSGIFQTLLHQASVLQKQKLADRAIDCYERALALLGEGVSIAAKAQIYDRLGDVYNQQNNLIPALDYYHQAASIYEKSGNFEFLALVLFNMGLIKLKQNDYSEGYQLLKKAVAIDEQHGFNNLSGEKSFLDQVETLLRQN